MSYERSPRPTGQPDRPDERRPLTRSISRIGGAIALTCALGAGLSASHEAVIGAVQAAAVETNTYPWDDAHDIRVLSDPAQRYDWGYPAEVAPY